MPLLQDIIHKTEVAGGPRYLRSALVILAVLAVIVTYNVRVAKNFGTQEAMDSAQLGRNIAEGKGFTTSFIRPFSLHLISKHNHANPAPAGEAARDLPRIRDGHPDISNAPLYPLVLAGAMKVLPFDDTISRNKPYWSSRGRFWRYQPDFLIGWLNQLLLLAIIAITCVWARRLFDNAVAVTTGAVLLGSEVLWKFSSSGLSTMLLILILTGIVWIFTLLQGEVLEPKRGPGFTHGLAAGAGLLIGLGALTRYGFGWLILPAALFVGFFGGTRRVPLVLTMTAAFAAVFAPWLVRNWNVSGTLFGTAGYDLWRGASLFPEHSLDRSLDPELRFSLRAIWMKLLINSRLILQNEFFSFAGGWLVSLFVVGWMIGFRNPVIRRMRYFIVAALALFFVVQALGRTQLSEDSAGVNSENFLVLLLPFIAVYAASLFHTLLDQIAFPVASLRHAAQAVLVGLAWLPLLFSFLPPRNVPIHYPPYYPPAVQQTGGLFRENELLMSDVPWAMAWYGKRQCVWLTLRASPQSESDNETFFAINDLLRPIYGVYLTPTTLDMRFESEIVSGGNASWGGLVVSTMLVKDSEGRMMVPRSFPLREVAPGYLPEQMLLTDWKRWSRPN